jgi:hypothetical protein
MVGCGDGLHEVNSKSAHAKPAYEAPLERPESGVCATRHGLSHVRESEIAPSVHRRPLTSSALGEL